MDYYPLFIDAGFGNAFGNPYSVYHTWKEIYKWTPSLPEGSLNTIIGGEVPMWGETNNQNTHFNKLFMRTSVMAEMYIFINQDYGIQNKRKLNSFQILSKD